MVQYVVCFSLKEATHFRKILQSSVYESDVACDPLVIADDRNSASVKSPGRGGVTSIDESIHNGVDDKTIEGYRGSIKRKKIYNQYSDSAATHPSSIKLINTLWILDSISNFSVLDSKAGTGRDQYAL